MDSTHKRINANKLASMLVCLKNTLSGVLNPKNTGHYNNRGYTNHVLRKYKAAIEDYSKAIELNPQDAIAYYNQG